VPLDARRIPKMGQTSSLKRKLIVNTVSIIKNTTFVRIKSMGKVKNTFENKHYYVYGHCIRGRNPQLDLSKLQISSTVSM